MAMDNFINPFLANIPISYLLKTPESQAWFTSNLPREVIAVSLNDFKEICCRKYVKLFRKKIWGRFLVKVQFNICTISTITINSTYVLLQKTKKYGKKENAEKSLTLTE